MINMPLIDVTFKQLSATAIERSERGIAILILKNDETSGAPTYKEYAQITELEADKTKYTATNYEYIADILGFVINKVIVINEETIADSLNKVSNYANTGWITIADGTTEDYNTLATWTKTKETMEKRTYKAIVYKATAPDSMHVVNFYNDDVTFVDSDGRGTVTGEKYLASLAGILASCNISKGCTYYKCSNLKKVTEVANRNTALQNGQFILFNDGDGVVRIAQGINSLTTTDSETKTEDMKFIENVETMDLILDDISSTFKEYIGHKNKYDNQILLISSINGYFRDLGDESVLDSEYDNKSDIDVETQRQAWITSGKSEASTWKDIDVRKTTYKRSVFLKGSVKILGSMTDLKFSINLF